MGPLVPEMISDQLNLIVAVISGIGFGFVLEQAGFSSTRKLVGLFYGYDFTVLKVFFTAGVTAMIGVLFLAHVNLLDLNIIYVNPTFLYSALVGGVIMGVGFIIGGFCPGTSICAAAIGKIDALIFIIGSILGIAIFAEAYPYLKDFYFAENWGAVRIDKYFSMSPELFAFLMTIVAIGAFVAVTRIENKVNKVKPDYSRSSVIKYSVFASISVVIILFLAITPSRTEYILHQIAKAQEQKKCVFKEISSDKLAEELIQNHYKVNLIDVREPDKFKKNHLPLAINIPLDEIMNREWKSYFLQEHKKNVFYADEDTTAKKACLKARFVGKSDNYILHDTTDKFREKFFNSQHPPKNAPKLEYEIYDFRVRAAMAMVNLEDALKKFSNPVKKVPRKIKGGCN